jgi:ParB family chromosome partitioning protein
LTDLGKFSETVGGGKAAAAVLARHQNWQQAMPDRSELWAWLGGLERGRQLDLLAYCVALTVDAVRRPWRDEEHQADADRLARALSLDMADWWRPTKAGFLERITKGQILQTVTEGVSAEAAGRLSGLTKGAMAEQAEVLLAESRWLPEPLRTPMASVASSAKPAAEAAAE